MGDIDDSISTIPPDDGSDGWEKSLRIVSLGLIAGFVVFGSSGFLGVRTSVASTSMGPYTVGVTHAAVTRAGLATPFAVSVDTGDGFTLPRTVTVRIDSNYLAMFDENGMDPDPVSSFSTPELTTWTFEVPPGNAGFEVSLDARLEPAVQWGRHGSVAVDLGDVQMPEVLFQTWVLP